MEYLDMGTFRDLSRICSQVWVRYIEIGKHTLTDTDKIKYPQADEHDHLR